MENQDINPSSFVSANHDNIFNDPKYQIADLNFANKDIGDVELLTLLQDK